MANYMNKYNKYIPDIKRIHEETGYGSERIAKMIIDMYPDDNLSFGNLSRSIRRRKFLPSSTVDESLHRNNLQENTWKVAWVKDKDLGISSLVKNPDFKDPNEISFQEIRDDYVSAIKEAVKDVKWDKPKKTPSSGNLFVPCIFDLHLGKLAWGEETGEDYDAKIAVKRFRIALEDLIQKANGYNVDRVLFPIGNDIYNSDKAKPFPQTTNGTPQMDDIRWQKLFRLGIQLITEAVIRLSKVAPVDVVTVFSNHDHERVFYLGETLTAVFDNNKNVTINNSPKVRKYYQWGECLIGTAHGHNEKPDDLPLIMAQEAKEMWSSTFYREWLLGHLHHKQRKLTQETKDYRGVRVTYLTSPSAADAWHAERAFVGAIKGAEAYIYNKDEGIIGSVMHNIK